MALIRGIDVVFSGEEKAAIMARLNDVVESNYFMWGDQQEEFQDILKRITRRQYAMTYSHVTIATEALFSILKPRVVAFQGNQFPSVIFAAQRQGAQIAWLDIDPEQMCPMFPLAVFSDKPDVLVWQHTGGFVSDEMDRVKTECARAGVFLIEDASQAMGTLKNSGRQAAGSWGDASFISFSATKFLTTGGQGAVVLLDDKELLDRMFRLKVYGRTEMFQRGDWVDKGWNAQMTETQAAIGNALFPFIDKWIAHRLQIARIYESLFDDTSLRPCGSRYGRPNWYKFPAILPVGVSRDKFKEYLKANDIECSSEIYPVPTYRMGSFGNEFPDINLSGTQQFSARHVCLPMHNGLTLDDAKKVVSVVEKFFREV